MNNIGFSGEDFIEIPIEKLREEVLNGIIDEFILQEGTDYGQVEYSLDEKRDQVKQQIYSGKAIIVFNQKTESCSVVTADRRKIK